MAQQSSNRIAYVTSYYPAKPEDVEAKKADDFIFNEEPEETNYNSLEEALTS